MQSRRRDGGGVSALQRSMTGGYSIIDDAVSRGIVVGKCG